MSETEAKRLTPWTNLGVLAVLSVILTWAYWPALLATVRTWWSNPDYNHGFIVVPIAAWLLYLRRAERPAFTPTFELGGLAFLCLAGLIRFVSGRLYLPELDPWSIPIWIFGAVYFFCGWKTAWWAAPSIAFLWFATPLPATIELAVSGPLQQLAANLSGFSLRLLGLPAITAGTTVLINDQVLDIERACSGLRMFYGVAAISVATVALLRPNWWKVCVIIAAAAPIAIFANIVRITITGLLVTAVSGEAAHKFSHDFAGVVMIPVAFCLFLFLLWTLNFFERKFEVEEDLEKSNGLRWVLGVTVLSIGAAATIIWIEHLQKQSIFVTLLETSRRLEAEEKWQEAIEYLNRYASARPNDNEAIIRLAQLSRKAVYDLPSGIRATDLNLRAWKASPADFELLAYAADMAMSLRRYDEVVDMAESGLSANPPQDFRSQFLQLRADGLHQYMNWDRGTNRYRWSDVVAALEVTLDLPNSPIRNFATLADAYRQDKASVTLAESKRKSAQLLDKLVEARPNDSSAWLARYLYYDKYPEEKAIFGESQHEADIAKAVELALLNSTAEDNAALLVAAERFERQNAPEEAIPLLTAAIKNSASDPRAYSALADLQRLLRKDDSLKLAETTLREGIEAAPAGGDIGLNLQLASVLSEQGRFDEAEQLLTPVEKTASQLVDQYRWPLMLQVAILKSQIVAERNGQAEAIKLLNATINKPEIRQLAQDNPRYLSQAWSQLGDYYASLGSLDQATAAYAEATTLTPDKAGMKLRQAGLAMESGDYQLAQQLYEEALAKNNTDATALLGLCYIAMQQEIRRPTKLRNWSRPMGLLEQAEKYNADFASVVLLKANLFDSQGKEKEAAEELEIAVTRKNDDAKLWRAVALSRQRQSDSTGALIAADRYAELSEDKTAAIELKADLLSEAGNAELGTEALKKNFRNSPIERRTVAVLALARHFSKTGNPADAQKLLYDEFQSKSGNKLEVAETLANYAWQNRNWELLEELERWFRTTEGAEGAWWRAVRAYRLLNVATATTSSEFEEAVTLVSELQQRRPRWPRSSVLKGELALRLNQFDSAIEAYKSAWQLGGRDISTADRLLEMLTRRGRHNEADDFIGEVKSYLEVSDRLFDRAAPYFARHDRDNVLQIAQGWTEKDPSNPANRLRLGRVYLLLAQSQNGDDVQTMLELAGKEFLAAIELAPNDVNAWISAITFFSRQAADQQKTLAILDQFAKQKSIAPFERAFILAQVYESLGRTQETCQGYYQAIGILENPSSTSRQQVPEDLQAYAYARASLFYLKFDPFLAGLYAEKAYKTDSSSPFSRRALLEVLANREDKESLRRAFDILESESVATETGNPASELSRQKAVFLAKRQEPGDLTLAIEILEQKLRQDNDDLLLLVSIYEKQGRIAPAWELLNRITSGPSPRPREFIELLRFWQANFIKPNGANSQETPFRRSADHAYQQLAKLRGGQGEVLRWQLREAIAREDQSPLSPEQVKIAWNNAVSLVLENRGTKPVTETVPSDEQLFYELFSVLIAEGYGEIGCQIVESPSKNLTNMPLRTSLLSALTGTNAKRNDRPFGKKYFTSLLTMPDGELEPGLKSRIGDYFFLQRDYRAAIDFYRKALEEKNPSLSIKNNLALALAEIPEGRAEAWEIYNSAIQSQGEKPELLDTRSVLELVNGDPKNSQATLNQLLEKRPYDATSQLHLAMALFATGQFSEAQTHHLKALSLGIRSHILTPRDQDFLNSFQRKRTQGNDE
ncbi:exosortase [Blastopirellula marina]|uniref:exosortase n=1 Tax=Blastopirellula marina TaxID=124 RepID=UPI0013050618|nr:exosortase [Blastopirellula marina]